MLRERYFIKLATREFIMKQALSLMPPTTEVLQCDHKLVASPNSEFLFSDVFQACCDHGEALT